MLSQLTAAPNDSIIALIAAFRDDPRTRKVDLGIGVYRDEAGITPIMGTVKRAEQLLLDQQTTKAYVGMAGNIAFNEAMLDLLLGDCPAKNRAAAVQTPGCSGALRLFGELIKHAKPNATVWISDPSYVNHEPSMRAAGLEVKIFPYFDADSKLVDETALLAALKHAGPDDVVLLQGSCHNPTGADISFEAWQTITAMCKAQGFLPFIDIAYQGFGDGLNQDVKGLHYLANHVDELLIAASCSKNFGLYRERTGVAIVIGANEEQSKIAQSQLFLAARSNYSMPPDHGASVVELIWQTPELKADWQNEVEAIRVRVQGLRQSLAAALKAKTGDDRWQFIGQHKGMFSVLGISPEQVQRLIDEHGVYLVNSGRINIAGMKTDDIEYIADALHAVTS